MISAGTEQFTDRLHARHQGAVHYVQGGRAGRQSVAEVGLQAVAPPVHHPSLQALLHRPAAPVLLYLSFRRDAVENPEQFRQRVVVLGRVPPVVNQVQADRDGLGGQAVEGKDAARVDDGGVEAGLLAFVQEHRVEGLAGGRAQPERNVGNPQQRARPGQGGLDELYALDGLDAVPTAFLHPGAHRQRQRVEKQIFRCQPVTLDGEVVNVAGGP
jgi:hypothetical protein